MANPQPGRTAGLSPADMLALVGDDADIRKRVKALCMMVLEDSIITMLEGDPTSKAAMTRLLLPHTLKMMTAGPSDEAEKLRAELQAVTERAFGGVEDATVVALIGDVVEDVG